VCRTPLPADASSAAAGLTPLPSSMWAPPQQLHPRLRTEGCLLRSCRDAADRKPACWGEQLRLWWGAVLLHRGRLSVALTSRFPPAGLLAGRGQVLGHAGDGYVKPALAPEQAVNSSR
jgi:hypothetical protein